MENHLFSGNWHISPKNRQSMITTKPLEKSKVFKLSCTKTTDAKQTNILLIADGKSFTITMCAGNNIVVQGKSIYIEQADTDESGSIGHWEIIQEPTVECEESIWALYPDTSIQNLIAVFEEEIDFVLYFGLTSECNNGVLCIIIDGREVKDIKGKTLSLLSGSSVIGKGKSIAISISGTCPSGNPFTGGIKIRKTIYPANKNN